MSCCFNKKVDVTLGEAIDTGTEELKKEGLGVLTGIGVQAA